MNQKTVIITAVILGVSVVGAAFIVANTSYKVKGFSSVITVTGSSEQTITSDVVKWQSGFSRNVTPDNLTQGYAGMKSDLAIIEKYLTDNGVATTRALFSQASRFSIFTANSRN